MSDSQITLKIEANGVINELPPDVPRPDYQNGRKSWVAIITHDSNGKDKMARKFWARGKKSGGLYYVSSEMIASENFYALEFGSDLVQGKSRTRDRKYFVGVVLGSSLQLVPCIGSLEAIGGAAAANELHDELSAKGQDPLELIRENQSSNGKSATSTKPEETLETGGEDMETCEILGMVTGLESAIQEEDWAGAEYLADRIHSAVKTKKLAAAAKARREQIEREKEWEAAHPEAGAP